MSWNKQNPFSVVTVCEEKARHDVNIYFWGFSFLNSEFRKMSVKGFINIIVVTENTRNHFQIFDYIL